MALAQQGFAVVLYVIFIFLGKLKIYYSRSMKIL